MKRILLIILVCNSWILHGQTEPEVLKGTVSYVTSQSVYVRFTSTEDLSQGDTLFVTDGSRRTPALIIRQLSSISAVCDPISGLSFIAGDEVVFFRKMTLAMEKTPEKPVEKVPSDSVIIVEQPPQETAEIKRRQEIHGRFAVSSYSNFSNTPAGNSQRMKYTFSMDANQIAGTRLSFETYTTFVHRLDEWDRVKSNIFDGLKIYNLAVRYEFDEKTRAAFGRMINPRVSSLGASDGLRFERRAGEFTIGVLAGSRPDYLDYGFNFDLFQYGAYLSHDHRSDKGNMQTTVAFVDQSNKGNTDRRFIYLQHSNALFSNLYFFGSAEFDLYKYVDGKPENSFDMTNLYLMLRYRVIRQLSLSLSYSARKSVIYYESYKDVLERLLEQETLQGFRAQLIYRPTRQLSIGLTGNYRFNKADPRDSKNAYGYITYSRIPVLLINATISATWLETAYLSGNIYSAGISRELVKGKLQAGLNYRYVDYSFLISDYPFSQNFAELNLHWNIYRRLSLSVYYEGAFEKQRNYNRVYVNLTQRF